TKSALRVSVPGWQVHTVPLIRAAAAIPADASAVVGQLPVLRFAAENLSRAVASAVRSSEGERRPSAGTSVARGTRWAWNTTFLGSLTAMLRKEVVGVTPDGLRINWHVISGSFVGPGLDATILPGAADWMRIRRDGVAIVSVQACFET